MKEAVEYLDQAITSISKHLASEAKYFNEHKLPVVMGLEDVLTKLVATRVDIVDVVENGS